jgi:N utilization substance protein B
VSDGLARLTGPEPEIFERAERLAAGVIAEADSLDREIAAAAEHWRLERVGAVERNLLRLAIYELKHELAPPRVIIDEALWLAHRFSGGKAPPFVNGVLDRVAHALGRL